MLTNSIDVFRYVCAHRRTYPTSAAPEAAVAQLETADSDATDVRVTDVNTGITEVLNMRVGCWRAPVHLWTEPTAA